MKEEPGIDDAFLMHCDCGAIATWFYMPVGPLLQYCDACVERGCSCTWDLETGEAELDELGRMLPCCEYAYDQEGRAYLPGAEIDDLSALQD